MYLLLLSLEKTIGFQLAITGKVYEGQDIFSKLHLAFILAIFKNKPLILKFTAYPPLQAPSGQ